MNAGGQIIGWNSEDEAHAQKLVQREAERLRTSFEAAKAAGFRKYIMFLHYPPTSVLENESIFTEMAEEYGAEHVVYSHCHGEKTFRGQYPRDAPWNPLSSGVRRLPEF